MILTCPNCTTRFILSATVLAPEGRNVKCSNCEEIWHELPDPDELGDVEQPVDIPESVKPVPEGSSVPVLHDEVADKEYSKMPMSYAAAACVFIFTFTLFLLLHQPIAGIWPSTHYVYGVFGMEPRVPGEGLVFDKLKAVAGSDHGKEGLSIEGNIINLAAGTKKVPMIKASLRKQGGEISDQWFIEPPEKKIAAEKTIAFHAQKEGETGQASEVSLQFVLRAKLDEPKTDEEDGDNTPAHDPDGSAHPNGGAKDSKSSPHASAPPHPESSHASPEKAPDDHHRPHKAAPADQGSSHH